MGPRKNFLISKDLVNKSSDFDIIHDILDIDVWNIQVQLYVICFIM